MDALLNNKETTVQNSMLIMHMERPERIRRLKEDILSFGPSICSERAELITESYKETEGKENILRRALGLKKILDNMTIYLLDNELLAGNQATKPMAAPIFPEYSIDWILSELNGDPYYFNKRPGDKFKIDDEVKTRLLGVFKYWEGKTHKDHVFKNMSDELRIIQEEIGVFDSIWNSREAMGHILPDFQMVIKRGFIDIRDEILDHLNSLEKNSEGYEEKQLFYKSTLIIIEAVLNFSERYVEKLKDLAADEKDISRKDELLTLAEICSKVPKYPAENFWEALQSYWMSYLINHIEGNGYALSIGRFDFNIYPYYQNDIDNGSITREFALELVENFWLKVNQLGKVKSWRDTQTFTGYQMFTPITLGGKDLRNNSNVNELSYMALKAFRDIRLPMPSLCIRYFNGIEEEFLNECIECIKLGGGMPAIYSDEVTIPMLLNRGVTIEDAHNWAIVGCVEPSVPGKFGGRYGAAFFNIAKVLELTLNGGRDPISGITIFKQDKDLSNYDSYEEMFHDFKQQIIKYFEQVVQMDNMVDVSWEEITPDPYLSILINDCIKRGKELHAGGAVYDYTGGIVSGIATAADSLAVLKKLVFEDKLFKGKDFLDILNNNFSGEKGEEARRIVINKAPKYGNNIDYVDDIAKELFIFFNSIIEKKDNSRNNRGPIGCKFHTSTATVASNVPLGKVVGATPNGRKAFLPVNDGMSPTRGHDTNGPTAVLKTIAKMPNVLISSGNLLNIKFNPLYLKGDHGTKIISDLLKTYFILGGYHLQINFVDNEVLKAAKKNPQNHKDLVVRVAGYSALFIHLDPDVQDDIIARTEHCFC
jgi:formate C-acetyltransferase